MAPRGRTCAPRRVSLLPERSSPGAVLAPADRGRERRGGLRPQRSGRQPALPLAGRRIRALRPGLGRGRDRPLIGTRGRASSDAQQRELVLDEWHRRVLLSRVGCVNPILTLVKGIGSPSPPLGGVTPAPSQHVRTVPAHIWFVYMSSCRLSQISPRNPWS